MANYGITDKGFKVKRLEEILASKKGRAVEIFTDLLPPGDIVDTSDSSILGRLIALDSAIDAELWELAQMVYLAFDPNSATGVALDNLVSIGGVSRIPESRTVADVYLYGDVNTEIPFGSEVRSPTTSAAFSLTNTVILDREVCHGVGVVLASLQPTTKYSISYALAGGTAFTEVAITTGLTPTAEGVYEDLQNEIANNHHGLISYVLDGVLYIESAIDLQLMSFYSSINLNITKAVGLGRVEAVDAGSVAQTANTITNISTPVLGWDRVTNPTPASTGSDRETDSQLRNRFRETKFQRATNIIEALYSALFSVAGVTSITIYENDTDVIDELGVLPHSFWVIVDGGLDSDIARAIWLNRPTGIRSQGNTHISIIDSFGYVRDIHFSRPEFIPLYIRMTLSTTQDFPPDGQAQIKANLMEHIRSLVISQDVVFSRLYTPINKVPGHQVDSLEISTDGVEWQSTNIEVGLDQKVSLVESNIFIS